MGDAGFRDMSDPLGPHGNKFTPEITELFLNAVRHTGMTLKAACGAVGIHPRTLERWHAKAYTEVEEGSPGPYTEFFLDVGLAEGNAQSTAELKQWQLVLEGDGPSIRRWLEAHDPVVWGRRQSRGPILVTGDHAQVAVLQEGTSNDPADYFGVEEIITKTIEAPE